MNDIAVPVGRRQAGLEAVNDAILPMRCRSRRAMEDVFMPIWKHAPAIVASLLVAAAGCTGGGEIRKSQHASLTQTVGHAEIEIEYSRPVARGRALFGALVPYGEPWNPGADQATAISFTRAVTIEGQRLPAGKYSIWIIPDTLNWVFILSRAGNVFHTPYPEGRDALRLRITPRRGSHMETLAFYFPAVDSTRAELVMHWGETILPLQIDAK